MPRYPVLFVAVLMEAAHRSGWIQEIWIEKYFFVLQSRRFGLILWGNRDSSGESPHLFPCMTQ